MKKDKQKKFQESPENVKKTHDNNQDIHDVIQPKKRKMKIKDPNEESDEKLDRKGVHFAADVIDNEIENPTTNKKRKSKQINEGNENWTSEETTESRLPTEGELMECEKPENKKNVASKRQRKREKFEKLKAENKLKSETQMQQKALNYLSLWKHNRNDWKFEKLRQVWVQNHMFDKVCIPDEFWNTVVEYFGGAKGKIRQVLTEQCMKILEENESKKDDSDEKDDTKYQRARILLQNVQE
ncbi:uncharacterized protein CBL_14623 [Carabus blaptoides fortunei]